MSSLPSRSRRGGNFRALDGKVDGGWGLKDFFSLFVGCTVCTMTIMTIVPNFRSNRRPNGQFQAHRGVGRGGGGGGGEADNGDVSVSRMFQDVMVPSERVPVNIGSVISGDTSESGPLDAQVQSSMEYRGSIARVERREETRQQLRLFFRSLIFRSLGASRICI